MTVLVSWQLNDPSGRQACRSCDVAVHAAPGCGHISAVGRHDTVRERHATADGSASWGLAGHGGGGAVRHPLEREKSGRGGQFFGSVGRCDGLLRPGEGNGDRTGRNWSEAACGTLSYYDAQGKRLQTISHDQMPQSGKTDLKRWLAQESSNALKMRPDLTMVAVADGAIDTWDNYVEKCVICLMG